MLKKRIIPTLLFKDNKLVKGINFNSWRTVGDVMQSVRIYRMRKVDELILLDISATSLNKKIDLDLINEVANECFMPLVFGGGIKTIEDISNTLKAGADKVCINTASINDIKFVKEACKIFGSQAITISVDYKKKGDAIEIWSNSGQVKTNLVFKDYLKVLENIGVGEIILTSIDKDGTMEGYDIATITEVNKFLNIPIIASGGAGSFKNMFDLLKSTNVSALAAGSIYHFTKKTPLDVKKYLNEKKIPVRIQI
jgi:imidazole glycerol-phosphate synthase subunit HisF